MNKRFFTCAAGVLVWSIGPAAYAQTQAQMTAPAEPSSNGPAAGTQIEEIVVTARKRGEDIQKVPVSISAFSGATLAALNVVRFDNLQQLTPGLTISRQSGDVNSPIIQLRGVSQITISPSTEPEVATYVDGVYSGGNIGGGLGQFLDLDRIEVLKGPQGTLYGRNSIGGAINVLTKLPTAEFNGQVGAGIQNHNGFRESAILNIPLITDKLAVRFAEGITEHDGWGKSLTLAGVNQPATNQPNPGSEDDKVVRGSLKFDPSDKLDIVVRGDYSSSSSNGEVNHPVYLQPGAITPALAAAVQQTGLPVASITAAARAAAVAAFNRAVNSDPLDLYNSYPQRQTGYSGGASMTISYDLGPVILKSISGYRKVDSNRLIDDCNCGFNLLDFNQNSGFELVTEEFQVSGMAFESRLKYVGGVYYLHKTGFQDEGSIAFASLGRLVPNPTENTSTSSDESEAVFAQGTYAILDNLNFTAGVRYTTEDKELTAKDYNAAGCQLPLAALLPPGAMSLPDCHVSNSVSDQNVSYDFTLDWTPVNGVMLYAKTARGYQAGGLNVRVTVNPASVSTYSPEKLTDYEGGIKADWLDHRLLTNLDVYHSDYANAQRNNLVSAPAGTLYSAATVITNAASASIDGVEGQISLIPFDNAQLSANFAYTEPKYNKYVIDGVDQAFLKFADAPRWAYDVAASYMVTTGIGALKAQLDWSWQSSTDPFPADSPGAVTGLTAAHVPIIGAGTPNSIRIQRSYGLLNGSLTLNTEHDLEIRLWATNLLDQRYYTFILGAVNSGVGFSSGLVGDPRMVGIDLIKNF